MKASRDIRLFLADVDGALVTKDKVLTEAAKAAVRELTAPASHSPSQAGGRREAWRMLIEPLALRTAIAALTAACWSIPICQSSEPHARSCDGQAGRYAAPRPRAGCLGLHGRRSG